MFTDRPLGQSFGHPDSSVAGLLEARGELVHVLTYDVPATPGPAANGGVLDKHQDVGVSIIALHRTTIKHPAHVSGRAT